jgi:hypothetical protein
MRMRMLGIVLVVVLACALPCATAGPTVNPGEWQITAKSEMTGLPVQVPAQTMTYTSCITPDAPVPTEPKQQGECKFSDMKTEGPAVTWAIECNGRQGNMKGTGKVVYEGDTMTGEQTMNVSGAEGMSMKMVMHMTGKRVGPCKEDKKK